MSDPTGNSEKATRVWSSLAAFLFFAAAVAMIILHLTTSRNYASVIGPFLVFGFCFLTLWLSVQKTR
ncbi:hypothetical protein SAMN04487905_101423 [Actinopolyspora xinjiangensis]|uniref:Uncharacterized protein n=1 Tax=Actinopolyspora xinjiangensis TaxID=405564 RepID=A0A1H0P8C8_9ACTN|nr:hypothetical protein [Actinopolyspora xinjiangensis]SDP00906.1 hypothetical protein SAMN04487905_101423 [Actinopolyspora xinjiangensis]